MVKKIVLGTGVLVILLVAGLFFWARAIFASETVRVAVEGQLTRALGQPVRIGSMGATVLPRVTMTLNDVRIGEPARITARRLDVGAALGALLSRRIEHGSIQLDDARVELPLSGFALGRDTAAGGSTAAPVEIVSIDTIALDDVEIVSGGRILRGDVEMAVEGRQLDITRADFTADGTAIGVTGRIDDSSGPTGELSIRAPSLDVLQLLAFVSDFAAGGTHPGAGRASGAAAPDPVPMNLTVSVQTDRAALGALVLDALAGRARVTDEAVTLDPIAFGVFGGTAKGALGLTLADTPGFRLEASLAGVDLAALTAFSGHPDLVTGRLGGRLDVTGRGTSANLVLRSTTGTARIDATDGSIKGLGLVRAIVLAGSMRGESQAQVSAGAASSPEPFTRLGATLRLAGGTASTSDLRFESKDVLLDAAGTFRLDGSNLDLAGQVQLSDALSAQAGRDLVRYTADQGRVTLPATITGAAEHLQVRIDTTKLLRRAITNRANEELKKGLGRLLGK